jgi:lysophospholipase L1-like esterase
MSKLVKVSIAINILFLLSLIFLGIKQYIRHENKLAEKRAEAAKDHIKLFLQDRTYINRTSAFTPAAGGVVMLGDSLTDLAEWQEYLPGKKIFNRGVSGDNTYGILKRLDLLPAKPDAIFIMAGANDLYWKSSIDSIVERYESIINEIKPASKIYIQSVLYVSPKPDVNYGGLDNKTITVLNGKLKELAVKHDLVYIDVATPLSDGSKLRQDFTTDGIHLNAAGYKKWAEVIKPYI